jgi:hypothetical protein
MNLRQFVFFVLVFGFIPGCATLGLETPRTTNERIAYGYAQVTGLRIAAAEALNAGTIGIADAEHVLSLSNDARAGIEAARALQSIGKADDALGRLALAEGVLDALRTYLTGKGVKAP